ncbi:MAG: MBOAT family protein [Clostridia bacterium]|nr:MBOAT family protein [Clostridia bacterium]
MLFNSLEFLLFLPITFLLYWMIGHKWRYLVLLAASYFFYMYWNPRLVFLILFTTIVSYLAGILLEKAGDNQRMRKLILAATLVTCLSVLLFFKYFNFLYDAVYDVIEAFGGKGQAGYFSILLPVGISFYTFQTDSYVIDVYKKTEPCEKHFGYYALFVIFFPQLVAGPIERPGDLLPQLKKKGDIRRLDYSGAFRYMLLGFFKKIAVADAAGLLVNAVYEAPEAAGGLSSLIATLLFSVQILCDFSGYSDIAKGSAKLFAVELTENFEKPYSSRSIKEFWNRWHLSLSRWLRDYLYFPLGGSRCHAVRRAFNILLVFFVSGLWHGASYNFIIWGLLHGIFQVIGIYTLPLRSKFWQKLGKEPTSRLVTRLRTVGTFLLVLLTWVFFRADTPQDAITVFHNIFTDYAFSLDYLKAEIATLSLSLPMAVYLVAALCLLPLAEQLKEKNKPAAEKERFLLYVILALCTVGVWIYLGASDVGSSFIYFQF